MNPEELPQAIRQEEEGYVFWILQEEHARANRHRERAADFKNQLHLALERRVRGLVNYFWAKFRTALARAVIEREDFENEVWVIVYRKVYRFDPARGCQLWTFLEQVLRNDLNTILRHLKRHLKTTTELPEGILETILAATESEVQTQVRLSEDREHFDAICDQMLRDGWPPDQIMATRLYVMEGLTMQQVADRMGRSLGWVHKAIRQTLAEVRRRW